MANIYISSVAYTAVAAWAAGAVVSAASNGGRGDYRRQLATPANGSERVFRCTVGGTTGGTEPAWTLTKNATTADNTVTWTECTGQEADQVAGTWKAPHARLANALVATWSAAGDDYYWASDHAETQATTITLLFPGTLASPNRMFCVVVAAGTIPPTSAQLSTAGQIIGTTSAGISLGGVVYAEGGILTSGSGASSTTLLFGITSQNDIRLKNFALQLLGTSFGTILIGSISSSIGTRVTWDNTTLQGASTNCTFTQIEASEFIWKNTAAAIQGATFPTTLFSSATKSGGTTLLDGVDLSALSGKTLVGAQQHGGNFYFKDCKLPASITVCATPTSSAATIYLIRSASGATAYSIEKHGARGDQTTETTIVRTGGTQVNGTGLSMRIAALIAKPQFPFECTPLVATNTVTGSTVTVTVYGVWAGASVPNNDEVWMEVGYLGSAASPLLSFSSGTKADGLAAGTPQASDSSTWGGGTTKFKLVATLSSPAPGMAGELYAVVKVASTNVTYIDPTPVLS